MSITAVHVFALHCIKEAIAADSLLLDFLMQPSPSISYALGTALRCCETSRGGGGDAADGVMMIETTA